jgi:hypothetical protein
MRSLFFLVIGYNLLFISLLSCNKVTKFSSEKNLDLNKDSVKIDWSKGKYSLTKTKSVEANVFYELFSTPTLPVQDTINTKVLYFLNAAFDHVLNSSHTTIKTYEDVKEACNRFEQAYNVFSKENNSEVPWNLELHIAISKPFNEIVTLEVSEYSFLGGAHGNGTINYYNYTIPDGKLLALKDLFPDINQLNKIAEEYFRKQHMQGDMTAGFNEYEFEFENNRFSVNENFRLTTNGLQILYNTYEIAPYVLGDQLIEIPWERVQPLLKKNLTPASE